MGYGVYQLEGSDKAIAIIDSGDHEYPLGPVWPSVEIANAFIGWCRKQPDWFTMDTESPETIRRFYKHAESRGLMEGVGHG